MFNNLSINLKNMENNRTSVYENLMGKIIIAMAFLLPVIFLPLESVNAYSVKIVLFATLGIGLLIVFLTSLLLRGRLSIPKEKMLLALLAVSLIAILSALVNGSFVKSFAGSIFEINTAAFWLLGVGFAILTALSINQIEVIKKTIFAFILGALVLLFAIVLKVLALYGLMPGSLNAFLPDYLALGAVETAIIMGAASLIALNAFIFGYITAKWQKILSIILIIGSLLFAGAIGFKPFIILVAVFSLAHFVYTVSLGKRNYGQMNEAETVGGEVSQKVSISPISLFVLVGSLVLLLGGASLGMYLSNTFKISSIDVRPNISSTNSIIMQSWKANPGLGVGPNKFANLWNLYKPDGVNITNFWNVDFANGFGYLPTLFTELGLLGFLAIIIFLVLFVYAGYKAVFAFTDDPNKRFFLVSSFFAALFLWIMTFLYTVGIVVLGSTFLLTGIFVASLSVCNIGRKYEINLFKNPKTNFVSIFIIVGLMLCSITAGYFIWERVAANSIFTQGQIAVRAGNLDKASQLFVKSAQMISSEVYWRESANIFLTLLQNKLSQINPNAPLAESDRAELQILIGNAIASANKAILVDKKNYANYFMLGNIYESLGRAGVAGASENAKANYAEAKKLSPANPAIPLLLARLSVMEGKTDEAFSHINNSLILKPNFTDAFFLKAQIEVATNNITGAIKSVEDATLVDPQNAGIYFQLGLLKYNVKDWSGAAVALGRASAIVPDYANAKYFLGLAYYNLKKNMDAIKQFEDLQKTNPDNQEIKLILSNLKAGRAPFTNAKPPVDDKPEKRTEPPIEE